MAGYYKNRYRVGELRPSQLLFRFGVGAVVDLPHISAMVMGLDEWDTNRAAEIGEDRLRAAVQQELGPQVTRLLAPPAAVEGDVGPAGMGAGGTFVSSDERLVGVPVVAFPRWVVCPYCRILAPLDSGLFALKTHPYRADQTKYMHVNCPAQSQQAVLPARFLVACPRGHLDDFPWMYFVHNGETDCRGPLRLYEMGVSGEAADIQISCDGKGCGMTRRMAEAFGQDAAKYLPACRGRRPHLRDLEEEECPEQQKTILLGASNSWFPLSLAVLSVPVAVDKLGQLIDAHWHLLEEAENPQNIKLLRRAGLLPSFSEYSDDVVSEAVERKRSGATAEQLAGTSTSLKAPEWQVFTRTQASHGDNPGSNTNSGVDFRTVEVYVPDSYRDVISRVVLVERLREVRALIGFTRIESPGDLGDFEEVELQNRAPLARRGPTWVPASEVRGEGIFIQFSEDAIQEWEKGAKAVRTRNDMFLAAHRRWRLARHLDPDKGYPELRYLLLHSFSHALMRQFALECGYAAASIRERIYSLPPYDPDGPMAGILLYTSAPDSEGTLGGLVSLGMPEELGRHIEGALEHMELCASDPLCAERTPSTEDTVLHGAACHACLFAPETSCERGNKYLDRTLLVPTVERTDLAFFKPSTVVATAGRA